MTWKIIFLALLAVTAIASPASAEESRSIMRQLLVNWFPLILIIGVWIFFIRQMQGGEHAKTQREVIARSPSHMDALERKLDRVIELLEQRGDR